MTKAGIKLKGAKAKIAMTPDKKVNKKLVLRGVRLNIIIVIKFY